MTKVNSFNRILLIVLDGAGIGAMPDAPEWGDAGSDTLGHILESRELLRQSAAADGAVREKGDVVLAAVRGDVEGLAKVWIEPVLHRLHVDDFLRALDLRDRDVRQSDVLALPFALQRGESFDALL